MLESEKMTMLEVMTGENDDEILTVYLTLAGQKILGRAYPYNPEITVVPERYHTLQVEIACYMLNKRGAEGQTGHNENGINRQYGSADVPSAMLRGVTPMVGVPK